MFYLITLTVLLFLLSYLFKSVLKKNYLRYNSSKFNLKKELDNEYLAKLCSDDSL